MAVRMFPIVSKWRLGRFAADQRGAAMIEFAVAVPLMLLLFSFVIEGTRLLWTHQVVVSGVRDAARYVSRVAPRDICSTGGSIAGLTGGLATRVAEATSSASVMPGSTSVDGVTGTLACRTAGLRIDPVGVVTVTATITVDHPLGGPFALFGQPLAPITYTVAEEARVQGE